jgi:HsdM N-terminal domain
MAKEKELKTETLEKQLWKAADKLRKNIDAAEYKHIVLGLIFSNTSPIRLSNNLPNYLLGKVNTLVLTQKTKMNTRQKTCSLCLKMLDGVIYNPMRTRQKLAKWPVTD